MATSKRISSSRHHMDISNAWLLVGLLVAAVSICTANAVASSTVASSLDQRSTTASSSSTGTSTQSAPATPHGGHGAAHKDDIYIDDDAAEGSGHGGHRFDLDSEPDYSGSGGGPDDEDTVTHSRNNFPKHHKTTGGKNNNHDEDFDGGSGDGGVSHKTDIRGENDDDEDNRFGHTSVRLPTSGSAAPAKPQDNKPTSKGPNDDLEIDEGNEEDEEKPGVDLDEENEEDEDEDEDDDHEPEEEDEDTHSVPDVPETHGVDPTTSDDEDLGTGAKDEDEDHTIHRGLDPYPEDKDRQNAGGSGATSGSAGVDKGNEVLIMNAKNEDRTTSFFSQPGILAAVIGGAVVGLLCAILVVMFIVYRMRKKDEGSYALDEPKRSPAVNSYAKNTNNREFYA